MDLLSGVIFLVKAHAISREKHFWYIWQSPLWLSPLSRGAPCSQAGVFVPSHQEFLLGRVFSTRQTAMKNRDSRVFFSDTLPWHRSWFKKLSMFNLSFTKSKDSPLLLFCFFWTYKGSHQLNLPSLKVLILLGFHPPWYLIFFFPISIYESGLITEIFTTRSHEVTRS